MGTFNIQVILPEIVLLGFAVVLLVAGLMTTNKRVLGLWAVLGIAAAYYFLPLSFKTPLTPLFSNMLVNDALSMFFRTVVLIIGGLVVLLSIGYKDLDDEEKGEYYFFILTMTISMMLAVASNNLMMIYIALEAISLLSYILAGYAKRDMFSSEAGLKYFLFGAVSTGITLYGVSLVYGLFGTLDLSLISQSLMINGVNQPALILAGLLVLVGFGFKCSLVPFHMWTPDVYQGAPTPVAAFFSVGPKAVGFAFLLRVFFQAFQFPSASMNPWACVCAAIAVLTMTLGNIVALKQDNIKRLLAYSTIAQAGYILLGITAWTQLGVKATLFYIFVYALMNLGAFGVVIAVSNSIRSDRIEDYAGLYKRSPFMAIALAVSFLSLAGIPPLAGFLAKFFVFAAALEAHLTGLVIVAALNSVVALYYYVQVVRFAFLHEPTSNIFTPQPKALILALGLITFLVLTLGLWPHPVLNWLIELLGV